jgi:hypothetical protein
LANSTIIILSEKVEMKKKNSKKKRENKESFEIFKIYICYKMESSKLIKYLSNMCGSYP